MRLWDADAGDLVGVYTGRDGDKAPWLAVSRDGRFATVAIQSLAKFRKQLTPGTPNRPDESLGRTEVIDLTTGERVFSAPSRFRPTWVMFGSDDRSVIMGSSDGMLAGISRIHILDAHSGKTMVTRELARVSGCAAAPSPDGQTLALLPFAMNQSDTVERDSKMLIVDALTLDTRREIRWIGGGVRALALNADGSQFAACGIDGTLRIHRADSGQQIAALSGHGMEILTVAFSPEGTRIASAGLDRRIRIWDTTTYDQVAALGGHEGHIGDLDWDQAGQRLVSCSGDSTVRLWEPVPIRTRVQAREARRATLTIVEPMVAKLFGELKDPASVVERLRADPSLDALHRKVAMQAVLEMSLEAAERAMQAGTE